MINPRNQQAGLSLLEVLIAILIMSVTILSLVNLQSVLLTDLDSANNQLRAEHIAFQLLEVYPDSLPMDLPNGWQYQIVIIQSSLYCQSVKVIIHPNLGNNIAQERWFCKP